jgi:hypothetical protein
MWESKNCSKNDWRIEINNKVTKEELLELLIKYFEIVEIKKEK